MYDAGGVEGNFNTARVSIVGFVLANSSTVTFRDNPVVRNCAASIFNGFVGSNSYGGVLSIYYGTYAYAASFGNADATITITGRTFVSNAAHIIASNIATNCSAAVSYGPSGSTAYGACNNLLFRDFHRDLQLMLDCFCRWLCLAVRRRLRVFKFIRRSIHSVDNRSDLDYSRQQPHYQQHCSELFRSCQQCLLWLQRIRCVQQPAHS